ncbi:MAG: hypothetical protein WCO68_09680 [Verrucomicrobiota bacterium]
MNSEPRGLAALAAQVGHYRLVFRWPERTVSLLLPALFVLSVLFHALAFYIFQVVYPPAVASAPPPAQVTLLTPDTREGAALLRWVQAQDPATAARTQEITPAGLGDILYTPSYATVHTLPLEMETPATPIGFPASHSLLDFSASKTATLEPPRRAVASALSFSEGLRARNAASEAPHGVTSKSTPNLRPTVFLAGLSDRGEIRYCFLLAPNGGDPSSGDPDVDKQAEALLREHRFTPSETPLEWGFATFTWGAEAYAPPQPQPQPAVVPGT